MERKERKSASIGRILLAASKDKVEVCITIGDKALHAIQAPGLSLLIPRCTEHCRLQVAARIRLCKIH